MRLFAAGDGSANDYTNVCRDVGNNRLFSVMNPREVKESEEWNEKKTLLMVDSGAHSWNKKTINPVAGAGRKDLPDYRDHAKWYVDWIKKHAKRRMIFVELDIYGLAPKKFIDDMYEEVMGIKGNFAFIRCYHPIIDGGTGEELKKWIDSGQKFVGVGNDSTCILGKLFKMTRDKVKVHGFAMTKENLLAKYPFYSADSTTPLSTLMYGNYFRDDFHAIRRDQVEKGRMREVTHTPERKLKEALLAFRAMEEKLTRLWETRGVKWDDKW